MKYLIFVLALSVGFSACSPKNVKPNSETALHNEFTTEGLDLESATIRSQHLSNVHYRLHFDLTSEDTFNGKNSIEFQLHDLPSTPEKSIFIDFQKGTITKLILNETSLDILASYRHGRIYLPNKFLKNGTNHLAIEFSHAYSKTGTGLHRFVDPIDHAAYVFTHLEPYFASQAFPCFDQPDLKAEFTLTALAPKNWQLIANTREQSISVQGNFKLWNFSPSQRFSSYVFHLSGGPFHVWRDNSGPVPMRLFARRTLAKYVDAADWFLVTKEGLKFYNHKFKYPYPFRKYDQIIVPDFNGGAMENVAAVTFTEKFVFRSKMTHKMRLGRSNTILHEMAHMWFGDLVTMKWWNDLWLNESFATFASYWALDHLKTELHLRDSWLSFSSSMKPWAYWEDQLITSHPISVPVKNTGVAITVFDGISYGKGASVLNQLYYYLGEKTFLEGLQDYFQKHAFKNATRRDFIESLAKGKDSLFEWDTAWIEKQGLNTIEPVYSCEDGKIREFKLRQGSAQGSTKILRPHRTQLALYSNFDQKPLVFGTRYEDALTEIHGLIGKPCPRFVLTNYQDYDYAKAVLDPESKRYLLENIGKFHDPQTRQILWQVLWQEVLDSKVSPSQYFTVALENLARETNEIIAAYLISTLVRPAANTTCAFRFLTDEQKNQNRKLLNNLMVTLLKQSVAGSDLQLLYFQTFTNTASSEDDTKLLRSWLNGKSKIHGLKLSQDRRWEIISALSRIGATDAESYIKTELERDPTDLGQKLALSAEVLNPDAKNKARWFEKLSQDPTLPLSKARAALASFYAFGQESQARSFESLFFKNLGHLVDAQLGSEIYLKFLAWHLYPPHCSQEVASQTDEFLKNHQNLPEVVKKELKVQKQETERCIRIKAN